MLYFFYSVIQLSYYIVNCFMFAWRFLHCNFLLLFFGRAADFADALPFYAP